MAIYPTEDGRQIMLLDGLMAPHTDAVAAPREAYHKKRGQMDDTENAEGETNGRIDHAQ